jgi:hypothetical protein
LIRPQHREAPLVFGAQRAHRRACEHLFAHAKLALVAREHRQHRLPRLFPLALLVVAQVVLERGLARQRVDAGLAFVLDVEPTFQPRQEAPEFKIISLPYHHRYLQAFHLPEKQFR